jgi:hypothetical protein
VQAYSYVANRLEASLPSVAPAAEATPAVVAAPAKAAAVAPIALVQMTDSKPYAGRPGRSLYLPCAMRPMNDVCLPLTAADREAMTRAWLADRTG